MSKSEKDIFQKFIKRVSEFKRTDFNQTFNEEYKKNIFNKNRINNLDIFDINNSNAKTKKKIMEFTPKNKNKDKIANCNHNSSSTKSKNKKINLKHCLRQNKLQNKNKNRLNDNYTNPFINIENKNFSYDNNEFNGKEVSNKNNHNDINNSSNHSNHQINNTNDNTYNNYNTNILENSENSENSNNKDDYSRNNNSRENHNNIYDKNKRKIIYDDDEPIESDNGGNKFKYLLIGFLGTYSAFIFLNKNEKFRKILKKNMDKINLNWLLDYIKIYFEKIKSYKYISKFKLLLNNGIDYLNKLFDGFNDNLRLFSVLIIIILSWYIIKLFFKFVFKNRRENGNEINEEDNIEMVN